MDIYVYGIIGPRSEDPDYVDANYVRELLDRAGSQPVMVRVNSPGGVAKEAVAIYNLLRRHRARVDTVVDALAASAASIIMLAGETRTMASGADLMIHSPWRVTIGDKVEHKKSIGGLEVCEDSMLAIYTDRTKQMKGQLRAWLEAETWMTPKEAKEHGFATAID